MKFPKIDMTPVSHPYPETTMFGAIAASAKRTPEAPAFDFMGKYTTYKELLRKIELAAGAFLKYGIKKNDVVTICMPNTPQAVICLYALNRIGAIANMVHPLSSGKNITFYLDYSESKMILTLDQFYEKVKKAVDESEKGATVIVARIQDELPLVKSIAFKYLKNRENLKFPGKGSDLVWSDFVRTGKGVKLPEVEFDKNKTAVILYSGGTSGTPKGIQLSDYNFNALGMQIAEISGCNLNYGCKFLSVMPIFHGFGLGVGIHTILENSAMCILIPQFTKESYAKAVLKKKPNFIAGVPTLFEALLRVDIFKDADLSFLIGVFSGGDALSPELKKRADAFFKKHNANLQIREGYGLTECVTASCVTPVDRSKEGSIGVPLRDMIYKIVEPGTFNELPIGENGEIIISGPTLMLGYKGQKEENSNTLKKDAEGRTWLFTGDMGNMDEEGFVYFQRRLKRLIITSGYNVYPTNIEKILDKHPDIDCSCVIGVPDPYKMQKVRAYIALKDGIEGNDEEKAKILQYCEAYLDVFERPQEVIFRQELPKTLVGKVAYHTLEEEAAGDTQVLADCIKDVLGTEQVSTLDNFFDIGGDSLKAIELTSRLEAKGYWVQVKTIFASENISELAKALTVKEKEEIEVEYDSVLPVTASQMRVYTAQMMEPDSTLYNIPFAFMTEDVDRDKLEKAVNKLIERHESLRTHFENRKGQVVQVIDEKAEARVEKLESADVLSFTKPFDLTKSPLIRVGYYENTVMLDMHHIISDGETIPVFFRELNELYMGRDIEKKAVQYGEFAVQKRNLEESEKYWLKQFEEETPVLELPTDYPRKEKQTFKGSAHYDLIDIELHGKIKDKCKEIGITPYVFYMTCFNIMLSKYSGNEDIVVGMPISGRAGRFLEAVGMFVNTIALRSRPEGTKRVLDLMKEIRDNSIAAIDNQDYPFGDLVKKLNIEVGGRNPIYDVMLAYQSYEMTDIVFGDKKAELIPIPVTASKCDLTFTVLPRKDDVVVMVEYCTDLYKQETVEKFTDSFKQILEICLDEQTLIKTVEAIGGEEKQKLIKDFNDTKATYPIPEGSTIYSLFEERAEKAVNKTCIITAEKKITFGEWSHLSEALDEKIRSITDGKKSVIAVIADRSVEMYSAIYGIIRGGNAYLPIDPEYPQDRIEYMLQNSGAALVLCQGKFIHLAGSTAHIDMTEFIKNPTISDTALPCAAEPEDTAYVIYTSGSTGNPKGAKISHKSAVNRILWMHDKYPLEENSVILQKTPYTFDVSVWEIFWWGMCGGSLAASKPGEHFLPAKILEEVNRNKVTHIHFVPSVFELFLNYLEAHKDECVRFGSVKHVFLSGEALTAPLIQRFYALYDCNSVKLHNLYGPTECAVDVTYYDCVPDEADPVPIGKPIYNTQMYVVDKYMNLLPIGVIGELCISGVNVGQGYLNNETLTAEKFVDNPFGEGKLYKTGDLAYWREDGELIFCGRMDGQIKFGGQRIETGEIEAVIGNIPQVEAVAVIIRKINGQDTLTAFYCGEEGIEKTIRSTCEAKMPRYMVPKAICNIKEMPLNRSGKLDRKVLSALEVTLIEADAFEEPINEAERYICDAFSKELEDERIGRNSNFFELGGSSLSMISFLSEDRFKDITPADFISNATPAKLAELMQNRNKDECKYLKTLYKAEREEKAMVLFPFAGGGAESYTSLVNSLKAEKSNMSIYFIRYLHSKEECEEAAKEIDRVLKGTEVYFYSHCVGSAIAMQLLNLTELPVKHYIAGASIPPEKPGKKNIWNIVPDKVLGSILTKAGAPLENLTYEMVKELLGRFREDTAFATESFAGKKEKIKTPVTVVISKKDIFTLNYKQAEKIWKSYAEDVRNINFIDSSSHYFQTENSDMLVKSIISITD